MVSKDPTTRFRRFEVLSFDCFGTLIDFERGVLTALRPILERRGVALSDDELLETYAALKLPIEQSSPFKPFREVLLRTMDSIGLASASSRPPPSAQRWSTRSAIGRPSRIRSRRSRGSAATSAW